MKLRELDAVFIGHVDFVSASFREQDTINGAQGVMFECPLCHGHQVLVWFKNPIRAPIVPDHFKPGPYRWETSGSSLDDLTLIPSVNLDVEPDSPCKWHGYVTNGEAK